jgi:rubrerythrin
MWFLVGGALVAAKRAKRSKARHVRCTRCGRLVLERPHVKRCPRCYEPLPAARAK